jgi:D-methionine transport system ATP-binding protein
VFATPQSATTRSLLRAYQPALPEAIAARLIAGLGRRTLVKVLTVGEQARAPWLSGLALDAGVRASLVQGGVDYVQGHAIGAQFLELDGGDSFPAALEYLRRHAHEVEVLGHVAGDD